MTTRDRRVWERVYGNGEVDENTINSRDSESGDLEKQKNSHVTSSSVSTGSNSRGNASSSVDGNNQTEETTERAVPTESDPNLDSCPPNVPEKSPSRALMYPDEDDGSKVTVRVAADEYPQAPERVLMRDSKEAAWSRGGCKRRMRPAV